MGKDRTYIIDFDSTLVQVEALDELAEIALRRSPEREERVRRIKEITRRGMDGEITIEESLKARLALLQAGQKDLDELVKLLRKKVTPSFSRNKDFLKKNASQIYIITSGFKEWVVPVIRDLKLKPENVLANSFEFDAKGNITGFDPKNPLSKDRGKVKCINQLKLKGEVLVIGDGFTDYQTKEAPCVSKFFAFTENVEREIVVRSADQVVKSFDEFLYVNKLPMKFSYPKSKISVLLLENVHPLAIRAFEDEGFSVQTLNDALDGDELRARIKNVSLLGVRSKSQVNSKVLKSANKLMAIGAFCIGTEQIELATASDQGIAVFNAPYSNTRSVVELALGEIIMLMRRVFEASTKLHQGIWSKSAAGSYEVRGKKLGIVGYGNIGSQLSVLAESLGMQVFFYDIVDRLALGNAKKCRTLDELLKLSDVVTLHVDGRASNKNLFSSEQFSQMKEGSVFLNLSRGSVVDIGALGVALKGGRLAGAALDVYPSEPKSNKERFNSELLGLPNVILTPHVGGSTAEAQANIGEYVSRKLIEYVNTGSSYFSVNFPQIQLPSLERAHRLLHLHRNVPGILAKINGLLAKRKINILGQYLKTDDKIGYVITDVNRSYDKDVVKELGRIPDTIKFRVLY